ncbi:MAG: diguanylate cyclase [Phycisphaera sp.]|nr:diguanylate cyclase [Phycisphaera sp.]
MFSPASLQTHHKAAVLAACLMAIMTAVVAVGLHSIGVISEHNANVLERRFPALELLLNVDRDIYQCQLAIEQAVRATDAVTRDQQIDDYQSNIEQSDRRYAQYQQLAVLTSDEMTCQRNYQRYRVAWQQSCERLLEQLAAIPPSTDNADRTTPIATSLSESNSLFSRMRLELDRIEEEVYEPMLDSAVTGLQQEAVVARSTLIGTLISALVIGLAVTVSGVRTIHRQHQQLVDEHAMRARESQRKDFETRLQRALDLARDETSALRIVGRALREAQIGARSDMMLVDSAADQLCIVASSNGDADSACPVTDPHQCPAILRNSEQVFADSESFEACPHLRNRPIGRCSAVCTPITVMGKTVGVLHNVNQPNAVADDHVQTLDAVATAVGQTLGLIRAFAQKEEQANTDPLTGLSNRRSLESRLPMITGRPGAQYAVAFGDIDRFKRLNDVHGHDTGDRALKLFSEVLRDALRPNDLVARWGGEEFVVVMPDTTGPQAVRALDRVRQQLTTRLDHSDVPAYTASFGVADTTIGDTFEDRLNAADEALLQAKRDGRDRVIYHGVSDYYDIEVQEHEGAAVID